MSECFCCCDISTGLRFLGWWWLWCIFSCLFYIWIPVLWVLSVVNLITYVPCFIVFIEMITHQDDKEHRQKLYQTFKWFGCIFGLPAYFGANIYLRSQLRYIGDQFCDFISEGDIEDDYDCLDTISEVRFHETIFSIFFMTLILGAFRIYFLVLMKRYCQEANHHQV